MRTESGKGNIFSFSVTLSKSVTRYQINCTLNKSFFFNTDQHISSPALI